MVYEAALEVVAHDRAPEVKHEVELPATQLASGQEEPERAQYCADPPHQ